MAIKLEPIVIEENGFRIEQVDVGSTFWDLYVKKTTNHKDGTKTTEWKIFAYGITFPYVIETIIMCRMSKRRIEKDNEPFKLQEFMEEYIKEREATIKSLNLSSINLTHELLNLKKELDNGGEDNNSTPID